MVRKLACLKFVFSLSLCLAVLFLCISPVLAQTSGTGALTGTVTDPSGAVISGATVTATNKGTGQERTEVTDASGVYKFSLLPAGVYSVKFTAAGFKTSEVTSLAVNVTETPVQNQKLEIGAQTQEVTVEATAVKVQTENATVGTLVGARTVTDLPLSTRNYTQIIDLSPGVVANVASASAIGNGTQDINVNGSGSDQNNYQMDGASITNYASGGAGQSGNYAGIGIPNPDAIQEFKIQTSQYDAGYGRNPGASVNVVTKGGTNQFHGAGWEFFRNEALDANDYLYRLTEEFQTHTPNKQQVLRQNLFGGTLGGPIKKDKLFFFGSYQGFRQLNGIGSNGFATGYSPGVTTLPFTNSCGTRADGCDGLTYREYLGSIFGGEKGFIDGTPVAADGSNISQTAINVLQAAGPKSSLNKGFYVPSSPAGCTLATPGVIDSGCVLNISQPVRANENQFLANSDYILSSKNTLSERYFLSSDPQVQSFTCLGSCLPGAPENATYTTHEGVLKLTSVLTGNFVNEARISFQRNVTNSTDDVSLTGCSVGIASIFGSGVPCATLPAGTNREATLIPIFGSAGTASPSGAWTDGGNFFAADTNYINTFQYADQISWTHGKHTLRTGFEYERTQWNWTLPSVNRGDMDFWNTSDFLTSGSPGSFGGVLFNFATLTPPAGPLHYNRLNAFSVFVQDDIKVSSRLTVNLGVRWEYNGWPDDNTGFFTNSWGSKADLVNTGSYYLANSVGSLAGYVVPSNYNPAKAICGNPAAPVACGLTAPAGVVPGYPGGATGVFVNSNKTLLPGSPDYNFAPRVGFAWQPVGGGKFVVRGGWGIFYDRVYGNLLVDNQQGNPPYASNGAGGFFPATFGLSLASPFNPQILGWTPRTLACAGPPPCTTAGVNSATLGLTGSALGSTSDSQNMTTPLIEEYNLGIQYEFAPNWVADIGYVGTHGTKLYDWSRDINVAHLVAGAPNEPTDIQNSKLVSSSLPFNDPANTTPITTNTLGNALGRVSYLGYAETGFASTNTDGASLYNSLQAVLRHNFSHGLMLQAAYTWSKSITDVNSAEAGSGISAAGNVLSGAANLNNPLDFGQQYGLAAFNRPQRLVISYSYDLPWKRTEGFAGKLLGGWTLSGVTTIQDGEPFSVVDSAGGSIFYGAGSANARAELADPVNCTSFGVCQSGIPIATSGNIHCRLGLPTVETGCATQQGYINAGPTPGGPRGGAFTAEPCVGGTIVGACATSGGGTGFGNSVVGAISGPGQNNFDMSLIKNTKLTENTTLQFRAEAYNIWNHAQFDAPSAGSTSYNDVNSVDVGRNTSTSTTPRILQFALKFLF
jgi:hypothetical protein